MNAKTQIIANRIDQAGADSREYDLDAIADAYPANLHEELWNVVSSNRRAWSIGINSSGYWELSDDSSWRVITCGAIEFDSLGAEFDLYDDGQEYTYDGVAYDLFEYLTLLATDSNPYGATVTNLHEGSDFNEAYQWQSFAVNLSWN